MPLSNEAQLNKLSQCLRETSRTLQEVQAEVAILHERVAAQSFFTDDNTRPSPAPAKPIPCSSAGPQQIFGLLRLPEELVELIANYRWTGMDQYEHPGFPNHRLALRDTCSELARLTFRSFARYFFTHVTVIFTCESPTALGGGIPSPGAIADTSQTLGRTSSAAKRTRARETDEGAGDYRGWFSNTLVPDLFSHPRSPTLSWDKGFLNEPSEQCISYLKAHSRQKDMEYTYADAAMLPTSLKGFRNLEAIEIANQDEHKQLIALWGARALVEAADLVSSSAIMQVVQDYRYYNSKTTFTATKVMTAIDRADLRHEGVIESLRIDSNTPGGAFGPCALQPASMTIPFDQDDPNGLQMVHHAFKHLKLAITPCHPSGEDAFYPYRPEGNFRSLLTPSVVELSLDFRDEAAFDFPLLGSREQWQKMGLYGDLPNLCVFKIVGTALKPGDIAPFITSHTKKLE